jgi:hypothetical protein
MKIYFLLALLLVSTAGMSQTAAYYCEKGTAINGYDVVAYFTQDSALKGSDVYAYQWNNAKWVFNSQAHLDLFKTKPEKYAPQYGGWCAYGVSENHKSPTDSRAFTIVDNKLYLNYNMKVMLLWRQDTTKYINVANRNWTTLKQIE